MTVAARRRAAPNRRRCRLQVCTPATPHPWGRNRRCPLVFPCPSRTVGASSAVHTCTFQRIESSIPWRRLAEACTPARLAVRRTEDCTSPCKAVQSKEKDTKSPSSIPSASVDTNARRWRRRTASASHRVCFLPSSEGTRPSPWRLDVAANVSTLDRCTCR